MFKQSQTMIALGLWLLASSAQAESSCRIEWGKRVCSDPLTNSQSDQLAALDNDLRPGPTMPPSYRDKSDDYKDRIAIKFGMQRGYESRRQLTNVVYGLAEKVDVASEEIWSCLSNVERNRFAMSLTDTAAFCVSAIKVMQ